MEAREGTTMRTVLIADDNAFIRTALYEFFQREPDFTVCGMAEDGREAVEEARRLHPDLIILDVTMPVMNGLEAARLLKRIMPEVRLIMYSATKDEVAERAAKLVGVTEIVSKSQRVSVLIDAARGLVHRKAA
ncbi:MAG TPA: response regulator transcription factor [Candidatus Sulfotelmatobacter sp.]|nr:response regulator transcription factor [Candidatus Sulfotelmatobacter sp.]